MVVAVAIGVVVGRINLIVIVLGWHGLKTSYSSGRVRTQGHNGKTGSGHDSDRIGIGKGSGQNRVVTQLDKERVKTGLGK